MQDGAADDPETDGCGWAGQRHPSSQNYLGGVCWRGRSLVAGGSWIWPALGFMKG